MIHDGVRKIYICSLMFMVENSSLLYRNKTIIYYHQQLVKVQKNSYHTDPYKHLSVVSGVCIIHIVKIY